MCLFWEFACDSNYSVKTQVFTAKRSNNRAVFIAGQLAIDGITASKGTRVDLVCACFGNLFVIQTIQ